MTNIHSNIFNSICQFTWIGKPRDHHYKIIKKSRQTSWGKGKGQGKAVRHYPRTARLSAFQTVISQWARGHTHNLCDDHITRLASQMPCHMHSLQTLPKLPIRAMTQLRPWRTPLSLHLFKNPKRHNPACGCETRVENVVHFFFLIPRFTCLRDCVVKNTNVSMIKATKAAASSPAASGGYRRKLQCTWRLKDGLDWGTIEEEFTSKTFNPPIVWSAPPHHHKTYIDLNLVDIH